MEYILNILEILKSFDYQYLIRICMTISVTLLFTNMSAGMFVSVFTPDRAIKKMVKETRKIDTKKRKVQRRINERKQRRVA